MTLWSKQEEVIAIESGGWNAILRKALRAFYPEINISYVYVYIYSLFWLSCLDVDYKGSLFWKKEKHTTPLHAHMSKTSDLSFPLTCQAIYQVGCLQKRRRRSFFSDNLSQEELFEKWTLLKKKMVEDEWRGIFFSFSWYRRQLNSTRDAAHRWQEPMNNFTCPIFCVRSISADTCAYAIGDVLEEKETNWIRGIQFCATTWTRFPETQRK